MNNLVQWMIGSTYFKKWSGIIGGFCAGMWAQATYWMEIRATREAWGKMDEMQRMAT